MASKPAPISYARALEKVKFLSNRTPETTGAEAMDAFALISDYRDGSIYVGHYAKEFSPNNCRMIILLHGF